MKLLDTTLRDGSYVINFQFSAADTRDIATELDKSGVDFIEVGHGVGIGASERGEGVALETDEAYMRAAADAVKTSKWGMFCIPGVASLDQLDSAIDHAMDFVRIGVSVDRVEDARAFIEKARQAGMYTCVNFMKSYTRSPEEFSKVAAAAADFGAEVVYIVDSAGNMTPTDVENYISRCREATDVALGFHGHNNLGLANANALKALDCGVDIVDSSLQGMGRCTGNTITEQFVALLDRMGVSHEYDLYRLMDASDMLVRPHLTQIGHDSVDLVCGLAGFHSSYMGVIRDASIGYDVDPRKLIEKLCEQTKSSAPKDVVEALAKEIAAADKQSNFKHRFPLRRYFGHEQDAI